MAHLMIRYPQLFHLLHEVERLVRETVQIVVGARKREEAGA